MPTSYIETKVEEFHNKVCDSQMFDAEGNEITDEILSFLKSSLESLLRKAIECVAEQYQIPEGYEKDEYQYGKSCGSHDTRQATLASLQALTTNK